MLSEIETVNEWVFSSYGFNIPTDWLEACILWIKSEYENDISFEVLCSHVFDQWIIADLKEIGFSCLSPDILTADKYLLKSSYCLQIISLFDVSVSLFSQQQKLNGKENENVNISAASQFTQYRNKDTKSCRMLMLKLTDGSIEISGMEFKSIPFLSIHINPGTKIIVKEGTICRHGVLMLSSSNLSVLGGEVEKLVEEKDDISVLQTQMHYNIENSEKFKKQLPFKSFNSSIKSKLKAEIKRENDFDDFDLNDEDMLICADGSTHKNELCIDQISSYQCSSIKKPRFGSLNDNKIKLERDINSRQNENCYCSDKITYPTNLLVSDNSNKDNNSNIDNFFIHDMDDNDFISPTLQTNPNPKSNQVENSKCNGNSINKLINKNDIAEQNLPHIMLQKSISGTITQNKSENITSTSNYNRDLVNDLDSRESNCLNEFKSNMTILPAAVKIDANCIVDDISSIINTQNNLVNLVNQPNRGNNYSTQQSREFYDRCVNLFKDDQIDETSNNSHVDNNEQSNRNNFQDDSLFTFEQDKLISDFSPRQKDVDLEIPFTYLSRILDNNLSGKFFIKAFVVTTVGSLSNNLGAFWILTVKINDGSRTIDVQLSNDVITNIVGFTAMECHEMKMHASKDLTIRTKLFENLSKIKDYLLNLSSILSIEFVSGSMPCVTNVRPINSKDIQLLRDRIFAIKSLNV